MSKGIGPGRARKKSRNSRSIRMDNQLMNEQIDQLGTRKQKIEGQVANELVLSTCLAIPW